MNYKKATKLFILITILSIAVWDVFVIVSGGTEASISQTMIEWSYQYPVFTFLIGFTMGHLFWRLKDNDSTKELK